MIETKRVWIFGPIIFWLTIFSNNNCLDHLFSTNISFGVQICRRKYFVKPKLMTAQCLPNYTYNNEALTKAICLSRNWPWRPKSCPPKISKFLVGVHCVLCLPGHGGGSGHPLQHLHHSSLLETSDGEFWLSYKH